ncbi:MAG: ABC transporter substrate-binding protein [Chloroflexi bacterium]|nr:ABC transporter substrate-binding protein [Chloroflexota bacterium]
MRVRLHIVLVMICLFVLSGCATAVQPTSELRPIVVGMPFIPNVQFAHFYVADQEGYFADEGLSVTFDYNFENDVVQRIATNNQITFALASADSILLARSKGLPVKAVMATTQSFPIGFISKSNTGITSLDDLRGKSIGIPGRFGASYIGLQAILRAGNLTEDDVRIQEIGFTQVVALREDNVDVVSGYVNNEPIQLRNAGVDVNVLAVSELYPLASDHLIVSEQTLSTDRALVEKFTRAMLRGMNRVNQDPDAAFKVAVTAIPEAKRVDPNLGVAILKETVRLWQPENLGVIQVSNWQNTYTLLQQMNLINAELPLQDAFDTSFVSQ